MSRHSARSLVAGVVMTLLVVSQLPTLSLALWEPLLSPTTALAGALTASVTKIAPTEIEKGDVLNYVITVENTGNDPISGQLADPVNIYGSDLVYIGDAGTGCTQSSVNDPVVCPSVTLAPSETETYILSFNAASSIPCNAEIENIADFHDPSSNQTVWSNVTKTLVTCPSDVDLSIQKTGPVTIQVGGTVVYTLTVTNAGPAIATDFEVHDDIQSGLTFVAGQSSSSCVFTAAGGGFVTCDGQNLGVGQSATFTIAVKVDDDFICNAPIENDAWIFATVPQTDPNLSNNGSQKVTTTVQCPQPQADLSVQKTGPATVVRGSTVTYTLTASNAGPANVTGVVIRDPIPAGLTFNVTASSAECIQVMTDVKCMNFDLASGQDKSFTVVFNVPTVNDCQASQIQNTANIFTGGSIGDPISSNNTSQTVTTSVTCPQLQADLSVTKTGPATATRAGTISYTLTAANAGPAAVTGVVVRDPIPTGLTFNVAASSPECIQVMTDVKCMNFDLASGQSKSFTVVFNAPIVENCQQSTITNTANIFAGGSIGDPNAANNTSQTVSTTLACPQLQADLSIVKSGPTSVASGAVIAYTLTAANAGPATATGVVVRDVIPAGLTFIPTSSSAECVLVGTTDVKCMNFNLTSGQSRLFTVAFQTQAVTSSCAAGSVQNVATIFMGGSIGDPNSANNTSQTVTTSLTCPTPTFTITKTDGKTTAQPGETLTYSIVVTNTYTEAVSVNVRDTMPTLINFVSASDGGTASGNLVTWNNIALNAGASKTLTLTATVSSSASNGIVLTNTATILGTNTSITDTTTVSVTQGSVSVTKTDNRTTVKPDETLSYVIVINNPTNVALTNVTVTDPLPSQITFLSATEGGYLAGQSVFWVNVTVPANSSKTLTFQAKVKSDASNGSTITNVVTVTTTTTIVASDTTVIESGSQGTITVEINDSPDPVRPCELLTYTIRVRNSSSSSKTVTVRQTLPSRVDFLSASDSGDEEDDVVEWDNVSIAGNDSKFLTTTVRARCDSRDGDTFKTSVRADGASDEETTRVRDDETQEAPECDDGRDNDNDGFVDYPSDSGCSSESDDDERNAEQGSANVSVQKLADRNEAYPGDQVYYSVTLRNSGSASAQNVTVDDTFNQSEISVSEAGDGVLSGDRIRWTVATLAPNETRVFTYRATLSSALRQGTTVQNTVRVSSPSLSNVPTAVVGIQIIEQLPQTGTNDYTGSLENTGQFLSPFRSANNGGSGAFAATFWSTIALMGAGIGGVFGRKYLL